MERYRQQMQDQLDKMVATGKLFRASISGEVVWDMYIKSFENDPIYRDPESSMHKCNLCNNFIRRYGNIVAIDESNNLITLWGFMPNDAEYIPVNKFLHEAISCEDVKDVFFETFESLKALPYEAFKRPKDSYRLGIHENVKRYSREEADKFPGVVKANEIRKFHHLSLMMPSKFVKKDQGSIEAIASKYRDATEVFARGMSTITVDTLELVVDLIKQGSLLDGDTHLPKIEAILPFANEYRLIPDNQKDAWCWVNSYENIHAKFKNTLIGVLCSELAEGMELNKACLNWNKRVDPRNYMKATAAITEKQIKEAKVFVDENGYTPSFNRRPATTDDIKASEILHLNDAGGEQQKDVHLFDGVKSSKSTRHKRSEFDKVETVGIDQFMHEILPNCTEVEAFLVNEHEDSMVTLTTAEDKNSKQIFKWNNNFSWTFNGNLAGKSLIKNSVKQLGGKVDGLLRFSIMWAEGEHDDSDLDAHCKEKPGEHIYYSHKVSGLTGGNLDVDIIQPQQHKRNSGKNVVENITYPNYPADGTEFEFYVHQYREQSSVGFKAEIEFKGVQYQYDYPYPLQQNKNVKVAKVTFKDGEFTIKHYITPSDGFGVEKEIYSLQSGHFHKVKLACLSPNHWGDNAIGNKYYFFFLEGAQAQKSMRSFHNENLKGDLVVHRKVMEVLANTTMVESVQDELSGIGFNATVRDDLVLRLKGSHKRVVRVKF